jgi:uncharacterized membrane protein
MWRYAIFRAGIDDLIFTQVVNGAFGTFSSTVEGSINHFLVHFSPILYVAVPLVKLFNGARGLILLQCLLAAATIFPVWGLAAARFAKPLAFAVTLVAAIYPPLSAEAVGDFHELAFVPPLAATLVWAIDRQRWRVAIAVAALLTIVKEDQFVSLAFIGVAVAIMARGDPAMRRCGLWISSIAIGAAVFYFGILRPLIDPHVGYFSLHFYQWWRFPPTPAGFAGPLSPLRPQYLFALLLPLTFLPLASRYMIFAIPGLAELLLSHEAITLQLGTHYTAVWIGYVLCAFVDGLARVYSRSVVAARTAVLVAFVASLWTSYYYSPIGPRFALYRRPTTVDRLRERTLSNLPRNASVGSGVWVLPHIAMNPAATVAMTDDEQYLVFDHFTDPGYWIAADRPTIRRLTGSGAYTQIYDDAGIVILERKRRGFST